MKHVLNRFKVAFSTSLLAILDGFVPFILVGLPPKKNECVLIVRADGIGDFVLWMNVGEALANHYRMQGKTVTLVANSAWSSWAIELNLADQVWEIDIQRFRKDYGYRWKWLSLIRQSGFSLAIQPTYSRVFLEGDSIIRASRAKQRIGSRGDKTNISSWMKFISDRWYTQLIPATSNPLMELKRNAEFMQGLGFSSYQALLPTIRPKLLKNEANLQLGTYAILAPNAGWSGRAWPIDNFAEIGRRLSERGLTNVIVGSDKDIEQASYLVDALNGNAFNLSAKTSLSDLTELIRGAAIIVTNETSFLHIALAVKTPTVCILGGGHYGRFAPYDTSDTTGSLNAIMVLKSMPCFGCNWVCKFPRSKNGAVKCISDVSIEQAWDGIEKAIKASNM